MVETLRDEILSGEIPPGTRLSAASLAGRFDESGMSVDDTLRQLVLEDLARFHVGRGTFVSEHPKPGSRRRLAARRPSQLILDTGVVQRGYVGADGMQLHYGRLDGTGPVLVLVHEVPRSWTQFGPILPHLEQAGVSCIAIDLPGYGASDAFPHRESATRYADVLGDAIEQLTTGPVWIAGVHSGALFAAQVAARRPHLVAGLLLTGLPMYGAAGPAPMSPPPDALGGTADGGHVARIVPHFQAKWGLQRPTQRLHDAALQALQAVDRLYDAYDAVFECDTAAIIPSIACPVHFLSAEDDALFAHDALAAGMLPQSTVQVARGIGRDLPWSEPRWYTRRVLAAMGIPTDDPDPDTDDPVDTPDPPEES